MNQLRRHIETCGTSQNQISIAIGVHRSSLSRFMRGERCLSCEHIDAIGKLLGLKLVRQRKS